VRGRRFLCSLTQLFCRRLCRGCPRICRGFDFVITFEHIELPAKLLDYFLRGNKSNINQSSPAKDGLGVVESLSAQGAKLVSWLHLVGCHYGGRFGNFSLTQKRTKKQLFAGLCIQEWGSSKRRNFYQGKSQPSIHVCIFIPVHRLLESAKNRFGNFSLTQKRTKKQLFAGFCIQEWGGSKRRNLYQGKSQPSIHVCIFSPVHRLLESAKKLVVRAILGVVTTVWLLKLCISHFVTLRSE